MEFITGKSNENDMELSELTKKDDAACVKTHGMIYSIKDMSEFGFITLRKRDALVQCVYSKENTSLPLDELTPEASVLIEGVLKKDDRAPNGFEIHIDKINILSKPAEALPINISKRKLGISLETNIALRPVTLRNNRERAVFKLQEGIVKGFRDFLIKNSFTEIRSPKIVSAGAEGGANIFKLDYFGKKAYLAQSPQVYKQTLIPVFERVFEIAPVFRAEKHNTTRHLNEYTSVDFELGFINGFEDIMEMETGMLKNAFEFLKK